MERGAPLSTALTTAGRRHEGIDNPAGRVKNVVDPSHPMLGGGSLCRKAAEAVATFGLVATIIESLRFKAEATPCGISREARPLSPKG